MEEVSIGDYVLTGGELPAMVLIDSVARMIPDVLSSRHAALDESVYSGLLEYPQYTKPRNYRDMEVPKVLVSGNHKNIHLWKLEQSLRLTKQRRPDLFRKFLSKGESLTKEEKKILDVYKRQENIRNCIEKRKWNMKRPSGRWITTAFAQSGTDGPGFTGHGRGKWRIRICGSTVSYTHLDVYKRQVLYNLLHFQNRFHITIPPLRRILRTAVPDSWKAASEGT